MSQYTFAYVIDMRARSSFFVPCPPPAHVGIRAARVTPARFKCCTCWHLLDDFLAHPCAPCSRSNLVLTGPALSPPLRASRVRAPFRGVQYFAERFPFVQPARDLCSSIDDLICRSSFGSNSSSSLDANKRISSTAQFYWNQKLVWRWEATCCPPD